MRDIAFVVYPGYSVMALAVVTAFEVANFEATRTADTEPPYELHFVSETGGTVKTSAGVGLETERFTDRPFDTLVVGGATLDEPSTAGLIAFISEAPKRHRRIAAVCTGAFVLAEAGLLNGRHVTTHWLHAPDLQRAFPDVKLDADRIFIHDGPIWTSAGMTAGLDLALALIEDDLGRDLATAVARKLVIYHRRGGGQSQFSTLLELAPQSDRIRNALTYARDNLHKPLTVPDLAEAAHLSPRQFSRAFHAETGQSPAKAVENLRVDAARSLMEQSRHPIDTVARQTGFSDSAHMRRAFMRAFGQPPQVLRRNARLASIPPVFDSPNIGAKVIDSAGHA
jgi:transcriptional regulator GlxA family with amidase domain